MKYIFLEIPTYPNVFNMWFSFAMLLLPPERFKVPGFFGHVFWKFAVNFLIFSAKFSRFLWNILILTSLLSKALKFCEIPKKFGENLTKNCKHCSLSLEILRKMCQILQKIVQRFWKIREIRSGAKEKRRARKTLKNDALDAKIGVDTAVNEPLKVWKPKNSRPFYRGSDR